MIQVGNIKQKASMTMVTFVFGCILVIIFLLYVKVKAEQKADDLVYSGEYASYLK